MGWIDVNAEVLDVGTRVSLAEAPAGDKKFSGIVVKVSEPEQCAPTLTVRFDIGGESSFPTEYRRGPGGQGPWLCSSLRRLES